MKTYVLMLARQFPSYHKRKGQPTDFIQKYKDVEKIHTIRENYELWKKRIDEVNEGIAVLSLRYWSGEPYKSKQIEFDRLGGNDVGIQKLTFQVFSSFNKKIIIPSFDIDEIAKNDGLRKDDFREWFKKADFTKPMAIIHFTSFRY